MFTLQGHVGTGVSRPYSVFRIGLLSANKTYQRLYILVTVVLLIWLVQHFIIRHPATLDFSNDEGSQKDGPVTFPGALLEHANENKVIFLALVDSGYLTMALNLYETSFKPLGIKNYLFVCSDSASCSSLQRQGINSIGYFHQKQRKGPTDFRSAAFKLKTHQKTKIILDGLRLGYTVIIVDVDIVFFKDPVPFFEDESDIQIQDDLYALNSGFYMARPTDASITLHLKAWEMAQLQGDKTSNQNILNFVIDAMSEKKQLSVRKLPQQLFSCGKVYFEDKNSMFYTNIPERSEVMVHNNYIVSKAAKIYRFKEHLLWKVDTDRYYSDPTRKYLIYDNSIPTGTLADETETLKTALLIGRLLNRTVILPTFSCQNCSYKVCKIASGRCALNTHYKIDVFDSYYQGMYREHVFLSHPLVPESVKQESQVFLIRPTISKIITPLSPHIKVLDPSDNKGPTEIEILTWFGNVREPVLRFHSLYDIYSNFRDTSYIKAWAFNTMTDYRQFKVYV